MFDLSLIKNSMAKSLGKASLRIGKYSPQILLGVGLTGMVGTVIVASMATLKLEGVLSDAKDDNDRVKAGHEKPDVRGYTEQEKTQDLAMVYGRAGLSIAKLYAPATALGVGSIACILGAHGILSKRNVGLAAAYNVVSQGFTQYRARVVDAYGEEIDSQFVHGTKIVETIETTFDEEGRKVKTKKKTKVRDDKVRETEYTRVFEQQSSTRWVSDNRMNHFLLKSQQAYANQELRIRGHVFLNDIFRALGFPETPAGQVVGWIYDDKKDNVGDNFIDFGIDNYLNPQPGLAEHDGWNIVLSFNVQGSVHHMI